MIAQLGKLFVFGRFRWTVGGASAIAMTTLALCCPWATCVHGQQEPDARRFAVQQTAPSQTNALPMSADVVPTAVDYGTPRNIREDARSQYALPVRDAGSSQGQLGAPALRASSQSAISERTFDHRPAQVTEIDPTRNSVAPSSDQASKLPNAQGVGAGSDGVFHTPSDEARNLSTGGASVAPTEDPQAAVKRAAELAKAKFDNAFDSLIAAVRGDQRAAKQLASDYLLPAITALVMLIVGYLFASYAGRIVGETMSRRVDLTLGRFFGKMTKTVLIVLTLSTVAQFFGIDVTSFAAILAAAGFAIGMALQGTLSNFAAGIMLLVFRPFKVGDFIVVNGAQGTVDEIELFTTRINSPDHRHLIVPNSQVFGSTIENVTCNAQRRVEVNVGVTYSADLHQTRHVLTTAVAQVVGAATVPAPQVMLADLGSSSVDWKVRVWCPSADYWAVRERTIIAVKEGLDAAGIGIPFPQLDLHVIAPARIGESASTVNRGQDSRRAA